MPKSIEELIGERVQQLGFISYTVTLEEDETWTCEITQYINTIKIKGLDRVSTLEKTLRYLNAEANKPSGYKVLGLLESEEVMQVISELNRYAHENPQSEVRLIDGIIIIGRYK